MAHIIFVKKILPDGEPCKKCTEVSDRLVKESLMEFINHIAIADQRDPDSEGMRLAIIHKVERAPFFIVEDDKGEVIVFDIYFKFKRYLADQKNSVATTPAL